MLLASPRARRVRVSHIRDGEEQMNKFVWSVAAGSTTLAMAVSAPVVFATSAVATTTMHSASIDVYDGSCGTPPSFTVAVGYLPEEYRGKKVNVIYGRADSGDVRVARLAQGDSRNYPIKGVVKPGEYAPFAVRVTTQYIPSTKGHKAVPEAELASVSTNAKWYPCGGPVTV